MTKTKDQIIECIERHVGWERDSEDFPNWYVGITANPEVRLFNDHSVNEDDKNDWIWKQAEDNQVAREVERHLIEKRGTQGGPGGGDDRSLFVYAYRMSSHTNQDT